MRILIGGQETIFKLEITQAHRLPSPGQAISSGARWLIFDGYFQASYCGSELYSFSELRCLLVHLIIFLRNGGNGSLQSTLGQLL